MTLCSIASGSSGNCIYIGTKSTHLLVDAGISAKRIEEGLRSINVEPDSLAAILITHEHSDHVQGLSVFGRKHAVPVYATAGTLTQYLESGKCRPEPGEWLNEVEYGRCFTVGDIEVSPFAISHDAVRPVSYTFRAGGHKIGMATDLGTYNETTVESLRGSEILYLEANHDENMLLVGSYPYQLKQRILGRKGHLSNDAASGLIGRLLHEGLRVVVLGHLSKENNYPELAYETVRQDLYRSWSFSAPVPEILVASRDKPSKRFSLE
ncbi:MAG: MBL fold metallo-hydrolase [Lachnospiraceae bacterium]|nr:MBL fold metallo-hydrolase [Lachnospiraceae bacterium]